MFPDRARSLIVVALCGFLLNACMPSPPPSTASDLAQALRGKGLAYNDTVSLPKPQGKHLRFDEAIGLTGPEYVVELIRIEDKRVFDIAAQASGLLTLTEAKIGQELPGKPEIYTRQPFIVIVRKEPAPGTVLDILNRILPPA